MYGFEHWLKMKALQKAEQANLRANLRQAFQIKIGDQFRLTYADVVNQELPTQFRDLLDRLDRIKVGKFHKTN